MRTGFRHPDLQNLRSGTGLQGPPDQSRSSQYLTSVQQTGPHGRKSSPWNHLKASYESANHESGAKGIAPRRERKPKSEMIHKRSGYWHLDATVNDVRYREAL